MGNFGVNFALDRSRDRKAEPRDIIYTRKEVDNSLAAQDEKDPAAAGQGRRTKQRNGKTKP